MSPIRLLVADDHALMRAGVRTFTEAFPDYVVVAEATNGGDAMKRLRDGNIDILVLDMNMPGLCGADLVASIHASYPALPILVFSMHAFPQVAQRALAAGAMGYLTKDSNPEVFIAALERLVAGKRFLDPTLAERLDLA